MAAKWSLTVVAFCLISAVLFAAQSASQSPSQAAPPAAPAQQAGAQQQGSSQSGYVLKVTTRLVTLDLIATDSRGNPVRDLKPEEVQVFEEHKAQQKIEHFEYFEKLKGATAADCCGACRRTLRSPFFFWAAL
jgi:hypothetical protein